LAVVAAVELLRQRLVPAEVVAGLVACCAG
jgi:hypothetical protein